jgi:UDP-N-acetylmuramyl tripeptide synthase
MAGPAPLPLLSRVAVGAGRTVAGASKLARLGTGSVIGGRLSLAIDHDLLGRLTAGREIALVSATNGKTTTTRLLAAALATRTPVVSNAHGANMAPGLVAALGGAGPGDVAALEVDEQWLPAVLREVGAATVLLLNLSRDQLDRSHEVRKVADTWRDALGTLPTRRVVANADDPLVVWAASTASDVVWVGTGLHWTLDAAGCPSCASRIEFAPEGWHCIACDFARPEPRWWLEGGEVVSRPGDGPERRHVLHLALPGRANAANAAMVLAASTAMGVATDDALGAMRKVTSVAGRYRTVDLAGRHVRLFLAKNPAGWQEAIEMLAPPPRPVVASINARIADGRDPSWLWDVPYERLQGRFVVATGERRHDLAVRLLYAGVEHEVAESLDKAVQLAGRGTGHTEIDLIANYTAFQDYLDLVGREQVGQR